MHHVAASAAGFAEKPIRAAEAVAALGTALAQFRAGDESVEPYGSFVRGEHRLHPTVHAWYASQPPAHLARVGAMHICRLMLVLTHLFEPDTALYAPPGVEPSGLRLDCEWTLECFRREVTSLLECAQDGAPREAYAGPHTGQAAAALGVPLEAAAAEEEAFVPEEEEEGALTQGDGLMMAKARRSPCSKPPARRAGLLSWRRAPRAKARSPPRLQVV